jgi:MFS superfamily sulfate permease-like transporter
MFLLVCVALIPTILHLSPLAALAAMLVYTGFRLAHPTEFLHVLKIGKEQLLIFVVTLVAVLATDLLIGIAIGIVAKLLIHLVNGVPLRSLFKPYLDVDNLDADTVRITARYSAIFSNWILFRKQLVDLGLHANKNVVLDLAQTKLVDHSVMEKLHEIQADFERAGVELRIEGLEKHRRFSNHELSARKLSVSA